jgi:MFS family permease
MKDNNAGIKLAIYSFSILMMGILAIAGGIGVIAQKFPGSDISALMSIPSIPIIIVTLIAGKLQEYISIKILVVIGILCFIIGGTAPVITGSFSVILVMRVVFGTGVGLLQTLSSALVGMHFDGAERQQVMGRQLSAQMLGAGGMMFAGGYLALISWNVVFLVHLVAVVSLIIVLAWLPKNKPIRRQSSAGGTPAAKISLTPAAIGWAVTLTIFFLGCMILAQFLARYLAEHGLGDAGTAGTGTLIFAAGGFLAGLAYGKLNGMARQATLGIGLLLGAAAYLLVAFSINIPMAFLGSFLYGGCVSIVMASVIAATAMSVSPAAIPLAIAVTTCGQNIGSYFCPYVAQAVGAMFGQDITKNVFIVGAILFCVMGVTALIWGFSRIRSDQIRSSQGIKNPPRNIRGG